MAVAYKQCVIRASDGADGGDGSVVVVVAVEGGVGW